MYIKNEHGQWYKGNDEWGLIKEIAEIYESIEDLPEEIGDGNKKYELVIGNDSKDIGYFSSTNKEDDWCYARIED